MCLMSFLTELFEWWPVCFIFSFASLMKVVSVYNGINSWSSIHDFQHQVPGSSYSELSRNVKFLTNPNGSTYQIRTSRNPDFSKPSNNFKTTEFQQCHLKNVKPPCWRPLVHTSGCLDNYFRYLIVVVAGNILFSIWCKAYGEPWWEDAFWRLMLLL